MLTQCVLVLYNIHSKLAWLLVVCYGKTTSNRNIGGAGEIDREREGECDRHTDVKAHRQLASIQRHNELVVQFASIHGVPFLHYYYYCYEYL